MLYPLFDKDCELVAWINPNKHIFDTSMNWVAYVSNGHAWSSETGNWLGPVRGLICLDQAGKPVAWHPKEKVSGTTRRARPARATRKARPPRPTRPARPARPTRPASPAGGWSSHSIYAWLGQ